MNRRNHQKGQTTVLTLVFLTVLLGMGALVLDLGSWYRADRAAQSTADAAALAGAQALPDDTGKATSSALEYAGHVKRTAPGFFAKLFGFNSAQIGATAAARAENIQAARYVAPIVVHYKHALLNCTRASSPTCNPTFGATTTLTLSDLHQPGGGSGAGAFGLINLNQNDSSGTASAGTLADWLANGFDQYMQLGKYYSAPSANFNNSQFLTSLDSVLGKEVLFPVYRLLTGPGSNAQYDIIGWVGFVIQSYNVNGSSSTITGYFTHFIADGIQVDSGGNPDFGVRKVELVN